MKVKRILFVSKGLESASTRYRALQYYPYFKKEGYITEHVTASGGLFAIAKTLWLARRADTVIVLRKTFPNAVTKLLRMVSKQLIFDLDDAIFCKSNGKPSTTRMKRFSTIAKCCDHIFAGNHFLAENSRVFNNAVTVIPTSVDVKKYKILVTKPDDFIDLVWIGSKSTSKYLIAVLPILENLALRNPNLRLKVIADFNLPDTTIPVLVIPWNEITETVDLVSAHIGIAPMIDNDWTRGKCALKVLQYMAANLPVVASNVGVNGEAVIAGETGYLVSTPEQWTAAIDELCSDQSLRLTMGKKACLRIEQHYDIHIVFQKMLTILNVDTHN